MLNKKEREKKCISTNIITTTTTTTIIQTTTGGLMMYPLCLSQEFKMCLSCVLGGFVLGETQIIYIITPYSHYN